jgi:hypothetical protein
MFASLGSAIFEARYRPAFLPIDASTSGSRPPTSRPRPWPGAALTHHCLSCGLTRSKRQLVQSPRPPSPINAYIRLLATYLKTLPGPVAHWHCLTRDASGNCLLMALLSLLGPRLSRLTAMQALPYRGNGMR